MTDTTQEELPPLPPAAPQAPVAEVLYHPAYGFKYGSLALDDNGEQIDLPLGTPLYTSPQPTPEDKRDAKRLDYLESLMRMGKGGTASFALERGGPVMFFSVETQHLRAGTVRAAIDAAISAGKGQT